eukprot:3079964-Pyramimonas_sp.AAC.1
MIGHARRAPARVSGRSRRVLSCAPTVCAGWSAAGSALGARRAIAVVGHGPCAAEAQACAGRRRHL